MLLLQLQHNILSRRRRKNVDSFLATPLPLCLLLLLMAVRTGFSCCTILAAAPISNRWSICHGHVVSASPTRRQATQRHSGIRRRSSRWYPGRCAFVWSYHSHWKHNVSEFGN